MSEESRVSRTPRTWTEGDDEPRDAPILRFERETLPWRYLRCIGPDRWVLEASPTVRTARPEMAQPWSRFTAKTKSWGPLTEVRLLSHAEIESGEVLPDAPEPQPECTCFTVPEERWTKHYDATEPGSMVEPNPDCPVHFPKDQGCCGACRGKGGDQDGPCSDCLGSGHAHDPGDPCPAPTPAADGPSTSSLPGHSNPDSEPGRSDLRAAIRRAIADPGAVVAARWPEESGPAWSARAVEQTLLAAGWRPPQPESDGDPHWQISTRVSMAVPVEERHQLFERVVAVVTDWETDDRQAEVTGHPADYLWSENQRLRTELGEADRRLTAARRALPASETERPRRCPAVTPEGDLITEGRQCQQYEGHAHDHTWYGDNGTAFSRWRVTP